MSFTTRPELAGTFGMVTSTHWLATAAGMKMLEAGGSAADAAVATGFVLNVVEPHLNGPLGDMPLLYRAAGAEEPVVICGQGSAPAGATIAHYRAEGLTRIPGSGLLATVVPGAFDAWMLLLRDHGRLPLGEVLAPAIHYARHGHPILPRVAGEIAGMADVFRTEWPTSAPVWLPGGNAPEPGTLFANPALADFWDRLVDEAKGAGVDRVAGVLDQLGVRSYMVEIGGEVRCRGRKPDGSAWVLGVADPKHPGEPEIVDRVEVLDQAMATSGDYLQFRDIAGVRVPHIVDPRTGRAPRHHVVSATVLAPNCELADALATALMVLDPAHGQRVLEGYGSAVHALVLVSDGKQFTRHLYRWGVR
ncbi:MAG: gamma-glutamyltransferase [Planctomycetes bacterium]|nr:gamma-glutamyltransferase [Planctomycetota bacterium]